MEELDFIERMSQILGEETTEEIPNFLIQVFDRIIEQNKKEKSDGFNIRTMCVKEDYFDNKYLEFCAYTGQRLLIIKDGIKYGGFENGDDSNYGEFHERIVKRTSTLLAEIEKLYQEIREKKYGEFLDKSDKMKELGKTAITRGTKRILEGTEIIDDENSMIDEDKDIDQAIKTGMKKVTSGQRTIYRGKEKIEKGKKIEEDTIRGYINSEIDAEMVLKHVLDGFERQRSEKQKKRNNLEETYYLNGVEIDKDIGKGGNPNPRPIGPTIPEEVKTEFELDKRKAGIRKLVNNNEVIEVNGGEFYAFSYDLANNNNGEQGHIIIIEPEQEENIATRVVYLSNDELEELMAESKGGNPEIEAKAKFVKRMLEDLDEFNKRGTRQLHESYGKWLAIMDYYLKGNKGIDPEILEMIDDDTFKKRFPREYLKDARDELIKDAGER